MQPKFIFLIAMVICGWATLANAEDKSMNSSPVSISGMTQQTFDALAPDAMLNVNGELISKNAFIAGRQAAAEELIKKMQATKAAAETEFAAHRKTFLDNQQSGLDADNEKARVEADRLVSAAQGPNWEARKKQAFELLDQATKASGDEREQLAKKAVDLLAEKK
jgi:hypothetical protein